MYEICAEEGIHTALFAYRSFEVFEDKDDYSFAISRMYTGAPIGSFFLRTVKSKRRIFLDGIPKTKFPEVSAKSRCPSG